jgi:hypothetical protein
MLVKPPPRLTNRSVIIKYLEVDLWTWLRDLTTAFTKINFEENFQSFTARDVSIPAGQEVAVSNQFRNRYPGLIPSGRIIVRQRGNANIIDGNTPWTQDLLYMQNPSENDAVVSILFYR